MIKRYLVEIDLPIDMGEEMEEVLTLHHHRIEEMIMDGTLVSYSESFEDHRIWLILETTGKGEALEHLSSLPLIDFVEFDVYELAVYEQRPTEIPSFSLN